MEVSELRKLEKECDRLLSSESALSTKMVIDLFFDKNYIKSRTIEAFKKIAKELFLIKFRSIVSVLIECDALELFTKQEQKELFERIDVNFILSLGDLIQSKIKEKLMTRGDFKEALTKTSSSGEKMFRLLKSVKDGINR